MTPLLVHGQSEPPATTAHEQGKRGKPEKSQGHRDKQSKTTKDQDHKGCTGNTGCPGKDPCRGQPQHPRQDPCRGSSSTPTERATFEPTDAEQSRWDRVREAPPWWHADLCEDKEQSRSKEDRKATILTKETHRAPRQDPCRGSQRAAARPLPGHPARPSPSAPARPLPGPHQPSSYRRSCAATDPTS